MANKSLVIVESPTKAKTLKKFLGKNYVVESSVGHIRDLPANAAEIPEAEKKNAWARLGVNVEDGFKPLYVIPSEKKKKVAELKAKLKDVDQLLLATDEDREGEAISWHLVETLKPKIPIKRMVFHEITKAAILKAVEDTREINSHLVEAQEARRIIDRLYGYELSPILWRKVAPRLSAGRVQSAAIRMIVEREEARVRFVRAQYWDLSGEFQTNDKKTLNGKLQSIDGKRLASGKDFDPDTGELKKDKDVFLVDGDLATQLAKSAKDADFKVRSTEEKPYNQKPPAPFTTSTLQQEGMRKLGFNARRTMRAAQKLYENGIITYMRTDSVNLSTEAVNAARTAVEGMYGKEFLPKEPRIYKSKVKNAQEAHEAIRPAGAEFKSLSDLKEEMSALSDEYKVYELIWMRTMACQMADSRGRRMAVKIGAKVDGKDLIFQATGHTIDFPGFLKAYYEGSDDPESAISNRETVLPPVKEGDDLKPEKVDAESHETQPPARFTEASLIKALEESGIGRPSTYASIIDTIQRREYTFKKSTALVPTFVAFAVVKLLRDHFTHFVDPQFTARMEDSLDSIARGEEEAQPYLHTFYFGDKLGLKPILEKKGEDIDARTVCTIPLGEDKGGHPVNIRVGKYGPYVQREEKETARIPDGTCPDELSVQIAMDLIEIASKGPESLGNHPETGLPIYVKVGRYGPYVQLGDPDPEDKKKKPKMVSLLQGMTPETLDFETACKLLELPKTLGQDESGVDIVAHYGRFGPYIKRGTDTRSLSGEDHILSITKERALELLAQEKKGRGFRKAAEPLKVFEKVDALDGNDIKVLNGRYGPYVSDGDTNASIPDDVEDPKEITLEKAVDLILARRAAGGGKKKKKKAKKKAAKKKTAKKTTKKATKKKTAKKKTAAKKSKKAT